jgi:hypothetical protein
LAGVRKAVLLAVSVGIVLSSFAGSASPTTKADVVFHEITATPPTSGSVAAFLLDMHVMQAVMENAGHKVYMRFPASFSVPSTIAASSILFKGKYSPSTVTVEATADGTTVGFDITGPDDARLQVWEEVRISVLATAGIRLPEQSNIYSMYVWTDLESTPMQAKLLVQQSGGNGQSVTGLTVQLPDTQSAGKPATYQVAFKTTAAGTLLTFKGDFVDTIFPDGSVVPQNLDPASVLIQWSNCTKVEVSGLRVRAFVPSALDYIGGARDCTVIVLPRAGILLPETPGNYALQLATSKDTSFVLSNQYTVTGTTVIAPSVTLSANQQGAPVAAEVTFTTSPVGSLLFGTGRVYVQFPPEATVPAAIADGTIKVAGRAVSGVRLGINRRLEVPVPVDIAPMTQVVITIPVEANIRNPGVAGVYTIKIGTSSDTDPASLSVTITPSQIGRPVIALSDRGAGAAAVYTVTFATGTGGILRAGMDVISVRFPSRMTVPAVILAAAVTVNGMSVETDPVVSGSTVVVKTPVGLGSGAQVSLVLGTGADLHNPSAAGPLTLSVSTTSEAAWIESLPVDIVDLPVVQALIEPVAADGQNQWYQTRPSVTFQASSAGDPSPFVYYQLDGGSPTRWMGPAVVVPDGTHTLTYYALDRQGQQSDQRTLMIAVDTVPPLLVVAVPQNGATVAGSTNVTVRGTTDPGARVTFNGGSAEVDAAGGFTGAAGVDSQSQLLVQAVDPAGNLTRLVLTLVVDAKPPTLSVTSPVPFQSVYTMPLMVEGTTEQGASVTVNEVAALVQADGRFSATIVQLEEGSNLITVIARDAVGNAATKALSVTYSSNRLIRMKIGSATALAVAPMIKNSTTFVPLRFVGEAFGASVQWDGIFQLIDISLSGRSIRLQIGNKTAVVNGKSVVLSLAPFLQTGTTMVPIRFVSEVLGATVVWDGATKTVSIFFPRS